MCILRIHIVDYWTAKVTATAPTAAVSDHNWWLRPNFDRRSRRPNQRPVPMLDSYLPFRLGLSRHVGAQNADAETRQFRHATRSPEPCLCRSQLPSRVKDLGSTVVPQQRRPSAVFIVVDLAACVALGD
jgi:hypothetical protein